MTRFLFAVILLTLAALVAVPESDACGGNASGRQGLLARLRQRRSHTASVATVSTYSVGAAWSAGAACPGGGCPSSAPAVASPPPPAPSVIVPPQKRRWDR